MVRAGRILVWTAGVVVTLVVAVWLALFMLPWDWARGPLERRLSDAIHRSVAVDGPLRVHFGKVTEVVADDFRIDNTPWGTKPQMAKIKRLVVKIYLPALLQGALVIPELRLIQPDLVLEKNKEGQSNWTFANPKAAAMKNATIPKKRSEVPIIERLVIEHGSLIYRDPTKGIDFDSQVNTAVGGDPQHQAVKLAGNGQLAGQPFRLEANGGSILALRNETRPYPLDVQAEIGQARGTIHGTVTDPLQLAGFDLEARVSGEDMASVFPIVGVPLPHTRPYSLEGRLKHEGQRWIFHDFTGKVGDSDLSGNLSVADDGPRPRMVATLTSQRIDYHDLAGLIGGNPGREEGRQRLDRMLPDTPLDIGRLRSMDMSVHFNGAEVVAPHTDITHLKTELKLDDGRAVLSPFSVNLAKGSVAGEVVLDTRQTVPAASFNLRIDQVKLEELFTGTQFAHEVRGVLAGRVDLSGQGHSTAQILANSNGRVSVFMGQGEFSELAVQLIGLNIGKALGLLATKDQPVAIRCMVADFAVQQGLGKTEALVFDTTASDVIGSGTINLGDEGLDLRLTPHPKTVGLVSARSDILVKGTFKTPSVGVDPTALAARGTAAAALGILLTPLGALLPFIQLGLGKDSPCGELIDNAKTGHQQAGLPAQR